MNSGSITEISTKPLRSPHIVMRLDRMGSFFPTRLSFMRTLLRRISNEKSKVIRPRWNINNEGYGNATYQVELGGYPYTLIAFSNPLAPQNRTDRVIAEAWDMTFVLFDGVPTNEDIVRLEGNAPKQEAGRFTEKEIVLCRANRSVRLFDHVVEKLALGNQPDPEFITKIGYLARTTAVYGNGKFGIADREVIADRPGLKGPFQAEMLAVWLVRGFTHDLVEHIAAYKNASRSTKLSTQTKRCLGIGNSTGLGMAPFLVSHPVLINQWMLMRETALGRIRAISNITDKTASRFQELLLRVKLHLAQWSVEDARQMARINILREEWPVIQNEFEKLPDTQPWEALFQFSQSYSLECQELVVSLLLEIGGDISDDLAASMATSKSPAIDPSQLISEIRDVIDDKFQWVLEIDFDAEKASQLFWYVSEEKLEPRIGERYLEEGAEKESPLDIARQIKALYTDIPDKAQLSVASFLSTNPQHRYATQRVQSIISNPYCEIQDNLIDADCLPIDMLRCKLSFFGASKFDPKSDRWTRINMYQGAPIFDDITEPDADNWWLPVLEQT